MELIILQPDSESISVENIDSLNILTIDGEITILPHHISIITALDIGTASVKSSSMSSSYAIHGGFLEVLEDKIVILANACEVAENIVTSRAEDAKERAVKRIAGNPLSNDEQIDIARAKQALKRAELRLKL
ncbi:MAG: ATP synthase F1 subunit epsilon [Dehalococcoidaceae bacterium]|nr:ATP synthase F1 subunit epsilon [Dehalococcoidaceae bacterium]|tara:strand:- start:714 stop:1109 length:396 start_codon:yes stop_codon:yes gene_type:complete